MGGASKDESTLPPGFRFHPTDEELITHYLSRRISDTNFAARAITEVDLNKCEPWDLPGKAKMGEKEWYFFSTRDRKYPTGVRTNRATNAGYWKTTGKDKDIFSSATAELVGMKKILVFYEGRAPRGQKTNWVMHEYRIHSKCTSKNNKDEWVVCRVFQKSTAGKKLPTNQPHANPYNIGMAPPIMPPLFQCNKFDPHLHHYQIASIGRSYSDLAELMRALHWDPDMNLPIKSQGCYADSSPLSGLNLNLVAPTIPPAPCLGQPTPCVPVLLPQLQGAASTSIATHILPGCDLSADAALGAAEIPDINAHAVARFQQVDHCMDVDGCYWPSC